MFSTLASAGVRLLTGFTGTRKGVNSFNTLHVKMQVFMVLYSERDVLPTWISASRCAEKVFQYPKLRPFTEAVVKRQDLAY